MSLTKKRIGELARKSLAMGYFAGRKDGMPTREYYCPLNPDRRGISHRIALAYWVGAPPKTTDVVKRFTEHFDPDSEECSYVEQAGGDPAEADRRAGGALR